MTFTNVTGSLAFASSESLPDTKVESSVVMGEEDPVFSISSGDLLSAVAEKKAPDTTGEEATVSDASGKVSVSVAETGTPSDTTGTGNGESTVGKISTASLKADQEISADFDRENGSADVTIRTFVKDDKVIFLLTNISADSYQCWIKIDDTLINAGTIDGISGDETYTTSKYEMTVEEITAIEQKSAAEPEEKTDDEEVTDDTEDVSTASDAFDQSIDLNGVTVTLHADANILPNGTKATATEVTQKIADAVAEKVESEDTSKTVKSVIAYDIKLYDGDGNVLDDSWSQKGLVQVTFSGTRIEDASKDADTLQIAHADKTDGEKLTADNAADVTADTISIDTSVAPSVDVSDGKTVDSLAFDAEHFSVYVITATATSGPEKGYTVVGNGTVVISGTEGYYSYYYDTWTSDNENVASVVEKSDGYEATVTGGAPGKATITHKYYKDGWAKNMSNEKFTVTVSDGLTVKFDKNGGSTDNPPSQKVTAYGNSITLPAYTGTKSGYTFIGWSEVSDLTNTTYYAVYPAGSAYTVKKDITLYAVWSKAVDGHFFILKDAVIPYEPSQYSASNYTAGITIAGVIKSDHWVCDTTGVAVTANLNSVPTADQIKAVCSGYDENSHYVLWYVIKYAGSWHIDGVLLEKSKINLSYDGNGNGDVSNVPLGSQYYVNDTVKVGHSGGNSGSPMTPTRPGYTFAGWNTAADGSGTAYNNNAEFTITAATVLYAQWDANSNTAYTVQWINADTDHVINSTQRKGVTGVTVSVNEADKALTGYTYAGDDHTGTVLSGTVAGDGSLILKLYFTQNKYTVTYTKGTHGTFADQTTNNLTYGENTPAFSGTPGGDAGYTFTGWNPTVANTVTGNITYTAQWSANTNTAYKVKHYKQDLGATTYTLADTDNLTGTTGATVEAAPKTYTGFTYDSTVAETIASGTVAGDGSLVLKLYYTRNSYDVTYSYTGNTPTGATALPATVSYQYGANVTVAVAATAAGYTFSGWGTTDAAVSAGKFSMPAKAVEIKGHFTANTNTAYKVEHYKQDLGAATYTLADTDNLTGTTGATVEASPKTYAGFTYDKNVAGTIASGTVAGNGSLVLKLYYTRNSYDVTYSYTGNTPTGATALPAKVSYQYGATVDVAAAATATGFTFSGWRTTDVTVVAGKFTMPAKSVAIAGFFNANTDTAYKVEHYKQDLGAVTYTLADTDNNAGTTGATAEATPKTYEGFAYDKDVAGTIASGTIAADGSLVLKLYYTRNSYDVTYSYTGNTPTGATALPAKVSYKYGANVTVAAAATAPGYTFNAWSTSDVTISTGQFTMPAKAVGIRGSFTANANTAYKVEHYKQDLDAATYTLADTDNLTGTTGATVEASPRTYEGFTYDQNVAGTIASGTVAGNGSLVLKLYYTRNSYDVTYSYTGNTPTGATELPATVSCQYGANVTVAAAATAPGYTFNAWSTSDATIRTGQFTMPANAVGIRGSFTANTNTVYKVEHYKQDLGATTYTLADTDNLTGTTDTTVTATPRTYSGFTYDKDVAGTITSGTVTGDGKLVLKLYYNRNNFEVSYTYTGTVPAGASTVPGRARYQYGANVTVAAAATAAGYTFSGWGATGTFSMPAHDVAMTGFFTANANTAYKVEHYKQDLDAATFTLADTDNLTGTTDTTATAKPKAYTGFTYDKNVEGTIASGTIAGDGSLVLKLFYTRNSHKVTYAYTGIVPSTATATPAEATYQYGANVTVAAAATAAGYTFSGWSKAEASFTMPDEDVSITGSFTANGDTAYHTQYYWHDLTGSGYTLHETTDGTGETDTIANAFIKEYTGFEHVKISDSVESGTIAGDGGLVLKVYYDRRAYDVTYSYTGTIPTGVSTLPAKASYSYGAEVTIADAATAPGYSFNGWSITAAFNMPADNVSITGSFMANENTAYKVEHYKQDLGTDTYTLADTDNLEGTTDSTVAATPKTYEGFKYDSSVTGTIASGTVAGDGSLVLKLYYTRDSYKVTYSYTGTIPAGVSTLPASATYSYGASVTVAAAATAPGYTFGGWDHTDFTMPAGDVSIAGSFTENANVTMHYEVAYGQDAMGTVAPTSETVAPATGQAKGSAASANPGYHFDHWEVRGTNIVTYVYTSVSKLLSTLSGNSWGENAILSADEVDAKAKNSSNIYEETIFTAYFAEDADVTINYVSENTAHGTVSAASETLAPVTGNAAGSTAAAATGYTFTNWTNEQGTVVSTTAAFVPEKVNGLNAAATYTAHFTSNGGGNNGGGGGGGGSTVISGGSVPLGNVAINPTAIPLAPTVIEPEETPLGGLPKTGEDRNYWKTILLSMFAIVIILIVKRETEKEEMN